MISIALPITTLLTQWLKHTLSPVYQNGSACGAHRHNWFSGIPFQRILYNCASFTLFVDFLLYFDWFGCWLFRFWLQCYKYFLVLTEHFKTRYRLFFISSTAFQLCLFPTCLKTLNLQTPIQTLIENMNKKRKKTSNDFELQQQVKVFRDFALSQACAPGNGLSVERYIQ